MDDLKDFNDLTALLDRHDSIQEVTERNKGGGVGGGGERERKGEKGRGGEKVELTDVRVYLDDSLSFSNSRYSIEYVDIPYAVGMDVRMLR